MELRQLQSLVSLAQLGSIAKVAENLHLSSAAVHKQLKVLEGELGVCLYTKNGRSLRLTQAAAVLLPYAKEVLAQHDTAVNAIKEWSGLKRGVLRIGAGPTLSSYVLPNLLILYRRTYPEIELLVQTGNSRTLIENLRNGSLDLALLVSPLLEEDASLTIEHSWKFEFLLVSNIRDIPTRCSIAGLNRFPFILFQKGSRMENAIDRYFTEIGFRPKIIMTFDSAEAIKALVRMGLGISMLPLWIIDAELQKKELSSVSQREPSLYSRIELVQRKSKFTTAAVSAFVKLASDFEFRSPRLTQTR